jgi:hypothetical protein
MMKLRRIRWAEHGSIGNCIQALVGKYEEKRPLGGPNLDGIIILKWIFKK